MGNLGKTSQPFGLYQKNGAGNWYLPVTDQTTGKRVARSTGTSDLREAIRRAPQLMTDTVSDLRAPVQKRNVWTLGEGFDAQIAEHTRRQAPDYTLKLYRTTRKTWIGLVGDIPLTDLSREMLTDVVDRELARGIQLSTIALRFRCLQAVVNLAIESKHFAGNAKDLIPKVIRSYSYKPRKRFLSPEEIQKILANVRAQYVEYVLTYLYTGARKSELFAITRADVNFSRNLIRLPGTKTEESDAWIPMAAALRPVIERRCANLDKQNAPAETPLFPSCKNFDAKVRSAWKKAGITEKVTTHDLRRTTGSLLASSGTSLRVVAEILRHSDIQVTYQTYAHLTPEASRSAIDSLPSFANPHVEPDAAE